MQINSPFLEVANLSLENLNLIYDWKYEESTFRLSFSQIRPSLSEFINESPNKFHSIKNLPPLFIIHDNIKVGFIYFERWFKEKSCTLSLFLNEKSQSKKIGTYALQKALCDLSQRGFQEVVAFVKTENIKAKRAFEKSGFNFKGEVFVPKYNQMHRACKYIYTSPNINSKKTFIIGEIGSNFSCGDETVSLLLAKKMIEEVYASGCDAAKFQLFNPQKIYVPNAGSPKYLNQDINEIFKKHALPSHFIPKLYEHANYVGIELMCSFFSKEDFEKINPYVQKHKIASYELRHIRLLELAAESQKPLFLSTGCASLEDIEWACETFFKLNGKNLTLFHCTASYPAQSNSLNLRCIRSLAERFKVPVGLSDHSAHPLHAPIAAVALGATAIEKHVTFHQKLPGPDHFFAINFKELKEMCEAICETEIILGLENKAIFPQEEELATFARRGVQAILPIKAGDLLKEDNNIAILRPGVQRLGIHPKFLERMEGKKALKDIPLGCGIQQEDVKW